MHCKGKTASGRQCTRQCQKGSKYCWQHQQKSQKSPQRSPKKSNKSDNDLQKRYCDCLLAVERKNPQINKYAICTKSVGRVSKSCKAYGH
jgi:hypothetical protein